MAAELTNVGSDADELPMLLRAVRVNLEQSPQQLLADIGYHSEAVVEKLADCTTVRQFSTRGLHRVTAEWTLVCMALHLRRMATLNGR